jgi:hypothetical protein
MGAAQESIGFAEMGVLLLVVTTACHCGLGAPATDPHAAAPIETVGEFSNMLFTEEHAYGYTIELWRQADKVFGFLLVAEGLQGDTPTGLLEEVTFEPSTGKLTFQAKLSVGVTYDEELKRYVPTRDIFRFSGVLREKKLFGTLEHSDALRPKAPPQQEEITLGRTSTPLALPASLAGWKKQADEILKARGPRW